MYNKKNKGIVFFLTGLSGSGKTTISNRLKYIMEKEKNIPVTLLDGDIVRTHLSNDLDFSKKDRILNMRRVGFVAGEIAKHGGVVVCAMIAPFKETRMEIREMVEGNGGSFVEVYVSTPLDVCENRDVKGLYAKARAGKIENFTGISSPYEKPENPDIIIDTTNMDIDSLIVFLKCKISKYI